MIGAADTLKISVQHNLDGVIDGYDEALADSEVELGRGVLSGGVGNLHGFSGYERLISHNGALWISRHRAVDSLLGRWTARDGLGYVDGPNFYGMLLFNPLRYLDSLGCAVAETCPSAFAVTPIPETCFGGTWRLTALHHHPSGESSIECRPGECGGKGCLCAGKARLKIQYQDDSGEWQDVNRENSEHCQAWHGNSNCDEGDQPTWTMTGSGRWPTPDGASEFNFDVWLFAECKKGGAMGADYVTYGVKAPSGCSLSVIITLLCGPCGSQGTGGGVDPPLPPGEH